MTTNCLPPQDRSTGIVVKLKFNGTDMESDTDFLADFRARILARKSVCPARAKVSALGLPRHTRPIQLADLSVDFCPTHAFPREDVRWGCTRVHVLYVINYRVHVYKITR